MQALELDALDLLVLGYALLAALAVVSFHCHAHTHSHTHTHSAKFHAPKLAPVLATRPDPHWKKKFEGMSADDAE